MDLEYIFQSDKLSIEQKNKWKELDEFFKTNSKYYKSIENEDAVFLVYIGGSSGDFILNTFIIDSLDKVKYRLVDYCSTVSKNRYKSPEVAYTSLVSPVLTQDNVNFQRTLKVPSTLSEHNDSNFKQSYNFDKIINFDDKFDIH